MKEEDIFTELNQPDLINYFHKIYFQRIKYYGIKDDDLNRFSWTQNKKVSIYVIEVSDDFSDKNDSLSNLIFAKISKNKNRLFRANLKDETYTPHFTNLLNSKDQLNWLIDKHYLPKSILNNIIVPSITTLIFDIFSDFDESKSELTEWIKTWFKDEYQTTLKAESEPTIVNYFPKTNQRYFVDRYHFDDMLKILDNDQFSDEFNQCLFAYEHEKWFLCAAGLGSCIEHLMLMIIQNYDKKGYKMLSSLGKEPTARNYIACFRKEPIQISSRQERFFNSIFSLRNAVDHHNTGKTQRQICDLLLDAISDIFNDYYSNSVNIQPKSYQSKKQ